MPELFVYLLKVNLAIVLFYLVYHLLLRRLTFYSINRFYLLFAFCFSAVYPLVNLREWFAETQEIPVGIYMIVPDWGAVQTSAFSIWNYLTVLFWLVVAFFVLRFVIRLFSLWQIHRASVPATWQFFHYRHVMQKINPFTFWKNIYVHVESHQDHELLDIFHHEQVHVEQLHTVDTLIAEIYTLFCWFNPASWLMRFAVRENLEFITDRRVIRSGIDKRTYQYSLLNLSAQGAPDELVSHFNLKHLKTRIMMMNKKKSSSAHLGKYVVGVPLIVLLATVFTLTKAYERPAGDIEVADNPKVIDHAEGGGVSGMLFRGDLTFFGGSDTTRNVQEKKDTGLQAENYVRKDSTLAILRGQDVLIGRAGKPVFVVDGKPLENFEVSELRPDQVESITVLKGQAALTMYPENSEAVNGAVIIATKAGSGTQRNVAERVVIGRAVTPPDSIGSPLVVRGYARTVKGVGFIADSVHTDVKRTTVRITGDPIRFSGEAYYTKDSTSRVLGNEPYVLIDGEEGDLSSLPVTQIKSIEIVKGNAEAIREYGPAAINGVVKVVTKK